MSSKQVAEHYSVGDLGDRILAALAAAGADPDNLTIEDLAPADALHMRGREATIELTEMAAITADDEVLDAGCGIGGTSRYLAQSTGCSVIGVDLTQEFVDVARMLTERVGLADRVRFEQGSVVELPFDNDSFDVAWTEHVQMNIADKIAFYCELYRVLRPGGRLAFHDIFAGPGGEEHIPVPWAEERSLSHLVPIEELRGLLSGAGFSQLAWEDKTAISTEFFTERMAEIERDGMPPIGLHTILDDAPTKFANVVRNLHEGRICVVQAVMSKPGAA